MLTSMPSKRPGRWRCSASGFSLVTCNVGEIGEAFVRGIEVVDTIIRRSCTVIGPAFEVQISVGSFAAYTYIVRSLIVVTGV